MDHFFHNKERMLCHLHILYILVYKIRIWHCPHLNKIHDYRKFRNDCLGVQCRGMSIRLHNNLPMFSKLCHLLNDCIQCIHYFHLEFCKNLGHIIRSRQSNNHFCIRYTLMNFLKLLIHPKSIFVRRCCS